MASAAVLRLEFGTLESCAAGEPLLPTRSCAINNGQDCRDFLCLDSVFQPEDGPYKRKDRTERTGTTSRRNDVADHEVLLRPGALKGTVGPVEPELR